jgi:hypothetical protein
MNQILYEDTGEKTVEIGKVIKFFAIAMIIFGIALIGSGVYGLMSSNKNQVQKPPKGAKPEIYVNVHEDDSIKINVIHDKAINKILYSWNQNEDQTILGQGRNQIEEIIDMPFGENVLTVRVIDIAGVESTHTGTYVLDNGIDIQKPTIDLSVVDGKIKITAKDETEIAYITYRWNSEDETKVEETDESKTIIETLITIQKGENDLTVIAVDKNNNTETKVQKFKAVTKPVIKVRQVGQDLTITATDEIGLKRIEYTLNGKKSRVQVAETAEWVYTIKLEPGVNEVIIEAINTNDVASDTFRGRATYNP